MVEASPTKERGILMHARSVNGILDRRKSQTRRIVKPQPPSQPEVGMYAPIGIDRYGEMYPKPEIFGAWCDEWGAKCPYGQPGDRLWVREMFWLAERYSYGTYPSGDDVIPKGIQRGPVHYAADGAPANTPNRHYPDGLRNGALAAPDPYAIWRKKPSIHMPRWASRITLEITDVRVERVQDISAEDALAEGVEPTTVATEQVMSPSVGGLRALDYSVRAFAALWDDTNGKGAWDRNDWVWALTFRRVEA